MARVAALALLFLMLGGCAAPQGREPTTTGAPTASPTDSASPTGTVRSSSDTLAACPGFEDEVAAGWAGTVRVGAGKPWDPGGNVTTVEMRMGETRTFQVEFTFTRAVPARAYNLTWSDGQDGRSPFRVTGPAQLDVREPCVGIRLDATVTATPGGDPEVPGYIAAHLAWPYSREGTSVLLQRA
jgi:hypothetical protein